jgi:hypothetical protein
MGRDIFVVHGGHDCVLVIPLSFCVVVTHL